VTVVRRRLLDWRKGWPWQCCLRLRVLIWGLIALLLYLLISDDTLSSGCCRRRAGCPGLGLVLGLGLGLGLVLGRTVRLHLLAVAAILLWLRCTHWLNLLRRRRLGVSTELLLLRRIDSLERLWLRTTKALGRTWLRRTEALGRLLWTRLAVAKLSRILVILLIVHRRRYCT